MSQFWAPIGSDFSAIKSENQKEIKIELNSNQNFVLQNRNYEGEEDLDEIVKSLNLPVKTTRHDSFEYINKEKIDEDDLEEEAELDGFDAEVKSSNLFKEEKKQKTSLGNFELRSN